MQDVLSKASIVDIESKVTTVGINVLLFDGVGGLADDNGSHGDNSKDSEWVGNAAGGKSVSGGAASVELPPFRWSDDEDGGSSWEDDEVGGRVSQEDDYFDNFGITKYTANHFDMHE